MHDLIKVMGGRQNCAAPFLVASFLFHRASAVVLLIFAASHLGFLAISDISHELYNPVFPFVTNRVLYVAAAMLEMAVGIACWKYAGCRNTNLAILTFVGIMVWYRWAFRLNGGIRCGCLGLLGHLLRINGRQETILPNMALTALTLATTPWLLACVKTAAKKGARLGAVTIIPLLIAGRCLGDQVIQVLGAYETTMLNPATQQPYPGFPKRLTFQVTISGDTWRLFATNGPYWEGIVYDGRNAITVNSYDAGYFSQKQPDTNLLFLTVSTGGFFHAPVYSKTSLWVPWLTYCLRPATLNRHDMPLPWFVSRISPQAFGYRWDLSHSFDGQFVERCEVVRDRSLDLPGDEREFFGRPELDPPDTIQDWNEYVKQLGVRKALPDGFIEARYQVKEWRQADGIRIPVVSEFEYFKYSHTHPKSPAYRANLNATAVRLTVSTSEPLPVQDAPALVNDYRYRQAKHHRIFEYAKYTLAPGQALRSEHDPALLAQAADWLRRGRRYDHFLPGGRNLVAWSILVAIVLPLVIVILRGKLRKPQRK